MNYENMLKQAGMLCEYDDLTRDTSNEYAILDELKKLKDTYLGDDFYWWDGTSWGGQTSKDKPLGYWDGAEGTTHYFIKNRYGTQFSIIVDTKQNIIIKIFLNDKCYATYNSLDEFEEFLKKRNSARKQKKSVSEYDKDQAEWISGAHENESIKIKNKNMNINEAKQILKNAGYLFSPTTKKISETFNTIGASDNDIDGDSYDGSRIRCVVNAKRWSGTDYNDWISRVKEAVWDCCCGYDISNEDFETFMENHADDIEDAWIVKKWPKEFGRTLFGKYFDEFDVQEEEEDPNSLWSIYKSFSR